MQTKKDRKSHRVCLNCRYMKHSKADYFCGKCMYDYHSVDHIRNHDWCRHWSCVPEDEYDAQYIGVTNNGWE